MTKYSRVFESDQGELLINTRLNQDNTVDVTYTAENQGVRIEVKMEKCPMPETGREGILDMVSQKQAESFINNPLALLALADSAN